jgi:hypothetical protein
VNRTCELITISINGVSEQCKILQEKHISVISKVLVGVKYLCWFCQNQCLWTRRRILKFHLLDFKYVVSERRYMIITAHGFTTQKTDIDMYQQIYLPKVISSTYALCNVSQGLLAHTRVLETTARRTISSGPWTWLIHVRFQVLTAASMMYCRVLPCKMIVETTYPLP